MGEVSFSFRYTTELYELLNTLREQEHETRIEIPLNMQSDQALVLKASLPFEGAQLARGGIQFLLANGGYVTIDCISALHGNPFDPKDDGTVFLHFKEKGTDACFAELAGFQFVVKSKPSEIEPIIANVALQQEQQRAKKKKERESRSKDTTGITHYPPGMWESIDNMMDK